MKKPLLKALLTLVILPFVWACSSAKEDMPLQLESNYSTVITGQNTNLAIKYGSGDYDIVPAKKDIVQAGFVRTDKSPGTIVLTGLKPGHTELTVTDKVTDEQVTVDVYVFRPYFGITGAATTKAEIKVTEGAQVPDGLEESLVKNEPFGIQFSFSFIQHSDSLFVETGPGSMVAFHLGRYEIKGTNDKPVLAITYDIGTEEISREYLLSGPGTARMLAFLKPTGTYIPLTRDTAPPDYFEIMLTEDLTEKVLKEYPEVTYAGIDIHCVCGPNRFMNRYIITRFY